MLALKITVKNIPLYCAALLLMERKSQSWSKQHLTKYFRIVVENAWLSGSYFMFLNSVSSSFWKCL